MNLKINFFFVFLTICSYTVHGMEVETKDEKQNMQLQRDLATTKGLLQEINGLLEKVSIKSVPNKYQHPKNIFEAIVQNPRGASPYIEYLLTQDIQGGAARMSEGKYIEASYATIQTVVEIIEQLDKEVPAEVIQQGYAAFGKMSLIYIRYDRQKCDTDNNSGSEEEQSDSDQESEECTEEEVEEGSKQDTAEQEYKCVCQ